MEFLLDELKFLFKEIQQVKRLLASPFEQQKLLSLKASLYQICIHKERLQTRVYETKNEDAIKIIKDTAWNNLKEYFDRDMRSLEGEDSDLYFIIKDELNPLLVSFEASCSILKEIFTLKQIKMSYGAEYLAFLENKKNVSNRKMIEKVKQNIIKYWISGGEARGSTLAITDRNNPRLLHAHIPAPLDDYRLEYYYEKDKQAFTFLRIARARDLGYSGH